VLAAGWNTRNTSRAVDTDIGKIIHDFRSSLNIIIGNSELMLDEVMGKTNEEQRQSLEDILQNSECLLDLVNDISLWRNAHCIDER